MFFHWDIKPTKLWEYDACMNCTQRTPQHHVAHVCQHAHTRSPCARNSNNTHLRTPMYPDNHGQAHTRSFGFGFVANRERRFAPGALPASFREETLLPSFGNPLMALELWRICPKCLTWEIIVASCTR